jgi:hypothetical protein
LLVVLADGREEKKRWGWRKEKKVGRLLQGIAVRHWRPPASVALLCVGLEPPESEQSNGDWSVWWLGFPLTGFDPVLFWATLAGNRPMPIGRTEIRAAAACRPRAALGLGRQRRRQLVSAA